MDRPVTAPGTAPAGQVTVDVWPHPLTDEGRITGRAPAGATLASLAADALPGRTVLAAVDGRIVPEADWPATAPAAGAVVTLRVPAGDDLADALRLVATIAVVAAGAAFGPAVGAALGLTGATATAVGAALITVGGTLVVNSLLPPPALGGPRAGDRPDPVYSLTGGSNRARLYEAVPLVLGSHRIFPDLAQREYATVEGDDQYLHAVYSLGLGDLEVEDIRIGETPAEDFDDIEIEHAPPGTHVTIAASDVDTAPGAELRDTGWVRRVTPDRTVSIEVEFTARLFRLDKEGQAVEHEAVVDIRVRREGAGAWPPATAVALTHDSQAVHRRVQTIAPPGTGVWEVEVRRREDPSDDARTYDDISWAALRSFQQAETEPLNQHRVAIRVRASGQLHGRLDRVSVTAHQRVPVWTGDAWEVQRTSNPAWILRWFALGVRAHDGRLLAGVGMPPERLDDEGLRTWGAWCDALQLGCNWIVPPGRTRRQTLETVARTGRASPTWAAAGRLGVVFDAPHRTVSAEVTPAHVVRESLEVRYVAGRPAQEIALRHLDPDLDWQLRTLRRKMPGVEGPPESTATATLEGVTSSRQAAEETNLQAAAQLWHRRRYLWTHGLPARDLVRGEVIRLAHDLLDNVPTGRLAGLTGGAGATLDALVAAGAGGRLLLTLPDGTIATGALAGEDAVVADRSLDGMEPSDVTWTYVTDDTPARRLRIVAMEPVDARRTRIEAIDEVDAYYDAASSDLDVDLLDLRRGPPRVIAHRIAEIRVPAGAGTVLMLELALTVAGDWRGAVVRAGPDGAPVVPVATLVAGDTVARWVVGPDPMLAITVTPGTETQPTGPVYRTSYGIDALVPPGVPTAATVTELRDGTRRFAWTPPADRDLAGILIRRADGEDVSVAWDGMEPMHDGVLAASPWESVGPAPGPHVFAFRASDHAGTLSADTVRVAVILGAERGRGSTVHAGTGPPDAALGEDHDLYVDDEGVVWVKADGAWSKTDIDLTGPARAGILTAVVPANANPPADVVGSVAGDVLLAQDGRWWEWEVAADGRGRWDYRGDLTGPPGDNPQVFAGGAGRPSAALGKDGDISVDRNGVVWKKINGAWVNTGVDITGPAAASVDAGYVAPNRAPSLRPSVVGTVFIATDGRWWEWEGTRWDYRGDFTGPAGGTPTIFAGSSGKPSNLIGRDGDISVAADGTVYKKVGGVWTDTGVDLTGPAAASVDAGYVAPSGTPSARPSVAGSVFIATDGRWWRWSGTRWVLQGSLKGPKGDAATAPRGVYNDLNLTLEQTIQRTVTTSARAQDGNVLTVDAVRRLSSGLTAADGSRTLNVLYRRYVYTYTYRASPRPSPSWR